MSICVIPARGGSKRIPRKNIKKFLGREMISYAIEVAHSSEIFEHVIVSTDDAEIARISRDCGAETPFERPANISDDHTTTVDVVSHAIDECHSMGVDVENVCCIYPCVPFLLATDLQKALMVLIDGEIDYVFPVAEFPSPVQRALKIGGDSKLKPFFPEYSDVRTQDLECAFYDVGQFYWGRKKAWLDKKNIHCNGVGVVIPSERAIDIDTKSDWDRAELMYKILT